MISNKVVLLEEHLTALNELLFDIPGIEGAAFILCGQSVSESVTKLISHAVIPIKKEEYLRREPYCLSISSAALSRVTKLARYENLSIIFAHSHPQGISEFSEQDDGEEEKLMPFLQSRVPDRIHGTLVLTESHIRGRLYIPHRIATDAVLTVGNRFNGYFTGTTEIAPIYDRQVRAFGKDVQHILSKLHIGVVGLGGTGSPLAEQLCRLGVGTLSLFDGDIFEDTNVNRVFGSRLEDAGLLKVDIAKRSLDAIGLGTDIKLHPKHITDEKTALALRDCDVIFGCTDKELPRAILQKVALHYSIPVLDLGVLIDSHAGKIIGVHGRVTTCMAGEACLFCRGRITSENIRIETLPEVERKQQIKEGYAPELGDPAPAVIAFTAATSSIGVAELLHRLTGFMGSERYSSEVLIAFDLSRIRTNRIEAREGCTCSDKAEWGCGDKVPFLELMWPNHTK
ncbi:ThiF family adenylyltransferase [Methylophilus flavus]|uniref:ThiF family adenylyltransferase n=1 Tax=Methylophilus flavus TaxID=640084 RepID=A0ABW3PA96_9PROT